MTTQLEAAEQELYEWATGKMSCISEMLNIEGNSEDRTKTLALVEARDADAIRAAREKVLALRLLASGVSSDDYTPTTDQVRRSYCEGRWAPGWEPGRVALSFDRWLAAHDAALLEAQSTELALCKTRARWVQVVVAELNADLDRTEAERDAARATIIKAHDVWAGSWQFGLEIEDRIMLSAILSRGAREATEPSEP